MPKRAKKSKVEVLPEIIEPEMKWKVSWQLSRPIRRSVAEEILVCGNIGFQDETMPNNYDDHTLISQERRPLGLWLLTFVNLLGGLCSLYFILDLCLSHHSDNTLFAIFGLVYTGSMGLSGIGLVIRKQWSWRLAMAVQLIVFICPLVTTVFGMYGVFTASGDFAYAAVLGGLLVSCVSVVLAILALLGMLHLMKPSVRTLFRSLSSEPNESTEYGH